MTTGPDSSRLDRIEAILLNLAERQDREMEVVAELRAAQVNTNQYIGELAETVADLAVQVGSLTERMDASYQQAERDRASTDARIQQIWEYLSQGRNGHSNGGNGG